MKILITGSSGFIGTALFRRLNMDHQVLLAGRYLPDIKHLDAVIHCAADPDPRADSLVNNIRITKDILEKYGDYTKKFVFLSSLKVYGNWLFDEPFTESYTVRPRENYACEPACMYGLSKLSCEHMIRIQSEIQKFESLIFRLGPVVGRQQSHGMLRDFQIRAEDHRHGKESFLIAGTYPGTIRPYTHIEDVVSAISLFPSLQGTFNLCASDEITNNDVADIVKRTHGIEDETEFTGQTYPMDTPVLRGNNTKLVDAGWSPKYKTSREAVERALYF